MEGEDSKRDAHRVLADHFGRNRMSARSVDELPWQLRQAAEWERLVALLADLRFLDAAWKFAEYEVLRYWATIERESPLRATEAYRDAVSRASGGPGAGGASAGQAGSVATGPTTTGGTTTGGTPPAGNDSGCGCRAVGGACGMFHDRWRSKASRSYCADPFSCHR